MRPPRQIPQPPQIGARPPGGAGFTLLEVLVALAILGTGLFVLLQNHYASSQLLAEAQEAATLQLLMQRAVADAEREVLLGNDDGDADFGQRYPEFSYTYTAVPRNEDQFPGLFEVTVNLNGPFGESSRIFYVFDGTQIENEDAP